MPKKIAKCLLFPPLPIAIPLIPISAIALIFSLRDGEEVSALQILSYFIAFYTLTIWCIRIPNLIRRIRNVKTQNPYVRYWSDNPRIRVNTSLISSLLFNAAYAVFQLLLGIFYRSLWSCAVAGYHASLALMRFFLLRHSARHRPGERMKEEWLRYRICGWNFLAVNLAVSVLTFYTVFRSHHSEYGPVTAIAVATYTFFTLTKAIVQSVRYRKYRSPVFSAAKMISLASACVSTFTLESAMLYTFGTDSTDETTRRLFLLLSGGALTAFLIFTAVYMIIKGGRMSEFRPEEGDTDERK